jgi:hypothetical protein
MMHRVVLSNGQVLLIKEDQNCIHLASEQQGFEGEADYYVCEINASGVLVMPNSGDAVVTLTQGLRRYSQ